jgi:hypothetical protein
MRTDYEAFKSPPIRLPDIALRSAIDERENRVRGSPHRSSIVLLLHSLDCPGCRECLDALLERREEIAEWDAEITVIVTRAGKSAGAERSDVRDLSILLDPESKVVRKLTLSVPSLAIADRWGEIRLAKEAEREHHAFCNAEEVTTWARFLAIECPECQGEAY